MKEGRFPFSELAKYPHMKPEDVQVWTRFLAKYPAYFDTVDYDVPVGQGAPQDENQPPNIQYDGKILTQKKIDVVGYKRDIITVVEIGPVADMRKLGQILVYRKLFTADFPDLQPPLSAVLCASVERELEAIFNEHGVMLLVA